MSTILSEIRESLFREIYADKRRQGIPDRVALAHSHYLADMIVSRMDRGIPVDMVHVGLGGLSLKKLVRKIVKPFEKAVKKVGKEIERVAEKVGEETKRVGHQIEQKIIRPVAHWKYLSYAANLIPGYGTVLSLAVTAAQAGRMIHKSKKELREFEHRSMDAYRMYKMEAERLNLPPLSYEQFKNALLAQAQGQTF